MRSDLETRFVLGGVLLAGLLALGQWSFLRFVVQTDQRQAAQRIAQSAGYMLQQAHETKDDLLLQKVIRSLTEGPGILLASVVDPKGIVLADSNPTRLGQPFFFHRSSAHPLILAVPLKSGISRWGTLYVGLSNLLQNRWMGQEEGLLIVGLGGVIIWAWGLGRVSRRVLSRELAKRQELEALHQNQAQEFSVLQENWQKETRAWEAWLNAAVSKISEPVIFLDHRQRIAGVSSAVAKRLDLRGSTNEWLGKSWHEIPVLAQAGDFLQKSLESPGQEIRTPLGSDGIPLHFYTPIAVAGSCPSTWAYLTPSPE